MKMIKKFQVVIFYFFLYIHPHSKFKNYNLTDRFFFNVIDFIDRTNDLQPMLCNDMSLVFLSNRPITMSWECLHPYTVD